MHVHHQATKRGLRRSAVVDPGHAVATRVRRCQRGKAYNFLDDGASDDVVEDAFGEKIRIDQRHIVEVIEWESIVGGLTVALCEKTAAIDEVEITG